jgi:hypothetical protein
MKILFCTYMVGAALTFTFMFAPIICVIISIAVVLYMVGLWHHYYKLIKEV